MGIIELVMLISVQEDLIDLILAVMHIIMVLGKEEEVQHYR
jgi:hypothetical protein